MPYTECVLAIPSDGVIPQFVVPPIFARDQLAALATAYIRRLSMVLRLLWDLVRETQKIFISGANGEIRGIGGSDQYTYSFGVSPLLLGITRPPRSQNTSHFPDSECVQWLDETRLLDSGFGLRKVGSAEVISVIDCDLVHSPATNSRWIAYCEAFQNMGGRAMKLAISNLMHPDPEGTKLSLLLPTCPPVGARLEMSFPRLLQNELVIVYSKDEAGQSFTFLVIDVEKTYTSKSLCILSETNCQFPEKQHIRATVLMTKKSGARSFIVLGIYMPPFRFNLIEVEELSGRVKDISQSDMQEVSPISLSQFSVSYAQGPKLCDVWDCNDTTKPVKIFLATPESSDHPVRMLRKSLAEDGFIFTLEFNELKVIEAASGFTVMHLIYPDRDLTGFAYPVCVHS
ncbi:hypothetical protein Pelo_6192 [Pelomyxa schiedti]|nr:hypothetical protein Pelo_6192 [Pelomyxa schiedti]